MINLEDREKIVVADSQVAERLERLGSNYGNDVYGTVAARCFNVDHLSRCPRELVSTAMNPSKYSPSSSEIARMAMNSMVKDVWIKRLNRSHSFEVSMIGYHAVDNTIGTYGFIDCILNASDLVFNVVFRYASSKEMIRIKQNGPYKRDVISASMLGHMVNCSDSMIIYSHGLESIVIHTKVKPVVISSVEKRCREMSSHFIYGTLPNKCKSLKCKFCHLERRK